MKILILINDALTIPDYSVPPIPVQSVPVIPE